MAFNSTPSISSFASSVPLYRFPDAQFLLGPLENMSFATVPSHLYFPSSITICCGFCDNTAFSLDTDLINQILILHSIQCNPNPGLPRCQLAPHSNWHIDIKFALFQVPTYLQPLMPVIPPSPANPPMPAPPSTSLQPSTSAGHTSILRNLLCLPPTQLSSDSGMVLLIFSFHHKL